MTRAKTRAKKKALQLQDEHQNPTSNGGNKLDHNPLTPSSFPSRPPPSNQSPTAQTKSQDPTLVPISDKALSMLNHMLGPRGLMQRDPTTGSIDVVLNTELFPGDLGDVERGDLREVLGRAVRGGHVGEGKGLKGDRLPSLEELLKLPLFETGGEDPTPALSKYLFHPHPSSSAPYQTQHQAQNQSSNLSLPARTQIPLGNGLPGSGGKRSTSHSQTHSYNHPHTHSHSHPHPRAQTESYKTPRFSSVTGKGKGEGSSSGRTSPASSVRSGTGSRSTNAIVNGNGKGKGKAQGMGVCDCGRHLARPGDVHAEDEEEDEEQDEIIFSDEDFLPEEMGEEGEEGYSFYGSEESFEYDDEEEEDEEVDEDGSQISHEPELGDEDEDDEDDEDDEIRTSDPRAGALEREDEREEAREFFSRVFGKGKQKERDLGLSDGSLSSPPPPPPNDHVCGPECRETANRQSSEARLQKELFFEKMKVAFMYDGWPEELLKKKWSELTDTEREYIRRTVLARATDGPICEDDKSRARLLRKGWPESALNKRWSELSDNERNTILHVEVDPSPPDVQLALPGTTIEDVLGAHQPPPMPGGWTGGKIDPILLGIGGDALEDDDLSKGDRMRELIQKYGTLDPNDPAPEISGPNGQMLDEPTKAEVRKNLARFHAKATETAKWIMSHLEASSGIDPYLRGSLEEAKQVFDDFRTNFKVPDFLQDQMNVAEVMYEDLNGHPVPTREDRAGMDATGQVNDNPPSDKKKKKKQKKKKKRKGDAAQQQQQQDGSGDESVGDGDGQLVEGNQGESSILDDPERLDWAANELFQWIKTVVWTIEQDAVRTARQMILQTTQPPPSSGGNKKKKKNNQHHVVHSTQDQHQLLQNIQVTWATPEQSERGGPPIKGTGRGVEPVPGMTWTPKRAPDAEAMRERMRSIGVDVEQVV